MYIHSTEVIMPLQDSVVNEYGSISHHGHYSDNDPKKKKPSYGSQGAKFCEKVHKPSLGVNVNNFELNGFNALIWVPWSPSDPKKL